MAHTKMLLSKKSLNLTYCFSEVVAKKSLLFYSTLQEDFKSPSKLLSFAG